MGPELAAPSSSLYYSGMRRDEMSAEPSGVGADFPAARRPLISVPGIACLLLAASSSYILLASLFVFWADFRGARFFNLYYLLMMAFSTMLAFRGLREVDFRRWRPQGGRRWLGVMAIFGMGFIAWIVYRYPELFSFSLWIDEITQFQGYWDSPRRVEIDPALFAAAQQQPPADYYLSAFARKAFGMSEAAVLAHAIAFGILNFAAFLLWLIQIRFPLALAPIPILLFASHHSLLQFSAQGRPISMAVFFALLTLIFTLESVQRRRAGVFALGSSAILLLYSVGLQPMFFLSILSVSLLPLLLRHFGRSEAAKLFLALSVIPLLLFSPTVWEIYRESVRFDQFHSAPFFELWWHALKNLGWESLNAYLGTFWHALWVLFICPLVFALSGILRAAGYRRFPPAMGSWALAGSIFTVLFPLAFQVFWGIINWNNNLYYYVLWPVGCFALASLCVAFFLRPFLAMPAGRWAVPALALLSAFATYSLHRGYAAAHQARVDSDNDYRPNWHLILKEAEAAARPVVVVEIPYSRFGVISDHSAAGAFYEKPASFRVARLRDNEEYAARSRLVRLHEAMRAYDSPSDVFFLIMLDKRFVPEEAKRHIVSVLRAETDGVVQLNERFFLFRANGQESPVRKAHSIFEKVVKADPRSDNNFYLVDALMAEATRKADCRGAGKWLDLLEAISGKLDAPARELMAGYLAAARERINGIKPCVTAGGEPDSESKSLSPALSRIRSSRR